VSRSGGRSLSGGVAGGLFWGKIEGSIRGENLGRPPSRQPTPHGRRCAHYVRFSDGEESLLSGIAGGGGIGGSAAGDRGMIGSWSDFWRWLGVV
jgi:hypothetical protein